jgi:ATP-binding cassette subfamily B protein
VERIDLLDVFGAFASLAQLVLAIVLFGKGTIFLPLVAVLIVAFVGLVAVGLWFFRAYAQAYTLRLGLTDALTDQIIGHRTRAVQQVPSEYHVDEDAHLSAYLDAAQTTDRARALLTVFPRLWLLLAGLVLYGSFVTWGATASLGWAAVGIALAYQAFASIARSLERIVTWQTALRGIEPLVRAGRTPQRPPRRDDLDVADGAFPVLLSATSLSFAYRAGITPILSDVTLRVRSGERILLVGPSGGGKTTLFKLIAGELRPTGGIVLVSGTDCHSVSDDEWRRRVASAPQFHENYIFAETVAFNLDPHGAAQLPSDEAREICAELGLDEVIARMPQGYQQILGETGWQLSHGERSRLYIARALLQHADLLLLDESFGALDPETQLRAAECVLKRAKTLLVISHA